MNVPGRKIFKGEAIYSDWFVRRGDGMIVRAERIDSIGTTVEVKIEVYTKNSDNAGDGSAVNDPQSAPATAPYELRLEHDDTAVKQLVVESSNTGSEGIKEMVRLRIEADQGGTNDWMLVRVFPPIFFDQGRPGT